MRTFVQFSTLTRPPGEAPGAREAARAGAGLRPHSPGLRRLHRDHGPRRAGPASPPPHPAGVLRRLGNSRAHLGQPRPLTESKRLKRRRPVRKEKRT